MIQPSSTPSASRSPLIAIYGGIGAGKSVVSRVLTTLGYKVYDCDSRAKQLMESDEKILRGLVEHIHPDCVCADGALDRRLIADVVFCDSAKLTKLNQMVHSAVRKDLQAWREVNASDGKPLFVESAIVYQSGLDRMVDAVWEVVAPEDVRVCRVMARNSITEEQVRNRIHSQQLPEDTALQAATYTIVNDDATPVLPQLLALLKVIENS